MILKIEELIEDCKKQIKDFTDIAIIGLSGGADSTLVAILCTLALGYGNTYGIEIPYNQSEMSSKRRSFWIIDKLGIMGKFIPIDRICDEVGNWFHHYPQNKNFYKLYGNIKARMRMIVLYAVCEELQTENPDKKIRVIGTDNYSENFLGYFTKWGDGGVDINPIEELYKSEVYQLLDYFKDRGIITEECINRVPSAGLWEGQTDEGELGVNYDEIEQGIRKVEGDWVSYEISLEKMNKILTMHNNTQHKREIPGHFELRKYCD